MTSGSKVTPDSLLVLTRQEQLLIVLVLSALLVGRAIQYWRHRLVPEPATLHQQAR